MNRRLPIATVALLATLALAGGRAGAASGVSPAHGFDPQRLVVKLAGDRVARTVGLRDGADARAVAAAARRDPRVQYAAPDYIATASLVEPGEEPQVPNDPGPIVGPPGAPGGWVEKQWNFLPWQGLPTPLLPVSPGGIDAIGAWENLAAAGRPGAQGVTVAVLDTGIAYRTLSPDFLRSPDFASRQFVSGYDFVDRDRLPLDENGHGTHVAGTIAEKTNNGIGLTGLAYRAKLMPVRVLDAGGRGRADEIASGIRFAVGHGADVINMSFNFSCGRRVPSIDEALRKAYERGVVAVASVGNLGSETCVSPPATGPHVIGVGGSTAGGCIGNYSLAGRGVDLLGPGGGSPTLACPSVSADPVYQVTLKPGSTNEFGEPGDYVGTSMAAAHISGVAAMTLAAQVLDPRAKRKGLVAAVTKRLRHSARSLGLPKPLQGAGLIDAAKATAPS